MQAKIKPLRLAVVLGFFVGLLFIFLGQLVSFYFFRSAFLLKLADKQHTYYLELPPQRGLIYDRLRRPLAVNVPAFSLYAVPGQVQDKKKTAEKLCVFLERDQDYLLERLSRKKQFIWLARKLDWDTREKIKTLGLDGLYFIKESRRSYPNETLASHVLGFAGLDNVGLDGIEMHYDRYLRGGPGWTYVLRDARRRDLDIADALEPPVDGNSLVLTIDQVIQYIAEREVEEIFVKYHAKGAGVVVMDVRSGEILAMAGRPTFDLNEPSRYPAENRRNRTVTDFFEPGSVFKIVAATAALEEGSFSVDDKIFCENGEYRVANHTLHDVHPYGWLSFREVIGQSSNIGTTKIAQKLGARSLYRYAESFGFGALTACGLPGEVSGVLKPVSRWSKTSISAIPIGQEVCVTVLQLASAIAAIANGGVYMKPFILSAIIDNKGEVIKSFQPQALRKVMSTETSFKMRQILAGVVETGTGKLAQSQIFKFAGKTGTAQKAGANGGYSHSKFTASFIGFAPQEAPEIAIAVVVDEPGPYYYGGVVCAPAFKAMAEEVLKYRRLAVDHAA